MLKKENRLLTRFEFNKTRRFGRKSNTKYFYFFFLLQKNVADPARVGFVATTHFDKRAVVRNRARRILREVFRKNFDRLRSGFWLVVYPKQEIKGISYEELNAQFNRDLPTLPFAK